MLEATIVDSKFQYALSLLSSLFRLQSLTQIHENDHKVYIVFLVLHYSILVERFNRQQMTLAIPLGHEPFGSELKAEWRFKITHERNVTLNMEVPFPYSEFKDCV